MTFRHLTDSYAVAPQLNPDDFTAAAQAGFTTVICNRPDGENPPSHHAAELQALAEAAGLRFDALPLTMQSFTPDNIAAHKALVEASEGPVLAYCASGTRSAIIWAFGQIGARPVDEIITRMEQAGYKLAGFRDALEAG